MQRAGSTSAARSVLAFECPKRDNWRCAGLYTSLAEQQLRPAQADARSAARLALRERLQHEAKRTCLIRAVLAEMMQLTRDCTWKPAIEEFPWAVGGQPVIQGLLCCRIALARTLKRGAAMPALLQGGWTAVWERVVAHVDLQAEGHRAADGHAVPWSRDCTFLKWKLFTGKFEWIFGG